MIKLKRPSASKRRRLITEGLKTLSPAWGAEREGLVRDLDALFEAALTCENLLHNDAENPIWHHTKVLNLMIEIAAGQGYDWVETRRAAAIAILHDVHPVPKITREMRDRAKKDPALKRLLDMENCRNRIWHMGIGSSKARGILEKLVEETGAAVLTRQDIAPICDIIAVHDCPSIDIGLPSECWLAVAFREADRLWMLTTEGIRADIMRKAKSSKGNKKANSLSACLAQLDSNLDSWKKERKRAYPKAKPKDFRPCSTILRTPSGYQIYKRLMDNWNRFKKDSKAKDWKAWRRELKELPDRRTY